MDAEDLLDDEGADPVERAVTDHINDFVRGFRANLPAESKTAQAIDRRESRTAVAQIARSEGHVEFADTLLRLTYLTPSHIRRRGAALGLGNSTRH